MRCARPPALACMRLRELAMHPAAPGSTRGQPRLVGGGSRRCWVFHATAAAQRQTAQQRLLRLMLLSCSTLRSSPTRGTAQQRCCRLATRRGRPCDARPGWAHGGLPWAHACGAPCGPMRARTDFGQADEDDLRPQAERLLALLHRLVQRLAREPGARRALGCLGSLGSLSRYKPECLSLALCENKTEQVTTDFR
jgi:hypothetical protein